MSIFNIFKKEKKVNAPLKLSELIKDEKSIKIYLKKKKFNAVKICYASDREKKEDDFYCDIYFRDMQYAYTVTIGLNKKVQSVLYYNYTLEIEDDIKEYPFELVA